MIELTELKMRNFLSYGNNWTSFPFQHGITKVSGENGTGKSTPFLDAIRFALFGVPYRKVKKGQLVNSKNKKNLEVLLHFKKQEDLFRIERGIKPDYFKIYKNDILIPVSSTTRSYQEILTEDILQYDENIDDQVNVKSMTKNTTFMILPKAEKRKIIENLLDIEVFSVMGKNLKIKIDQTESEIKSVKKDIDNSDLLICQERSNLEKLTNLKRKIENDVNANNTLHKEEISTLTESIFSFTKGLEIIERKKVEYKNLIDSINSVKLAIKQCDQKRLKYEALIQMNNKKVKFLQKTCNNCSKIEELLNDLEVKEAIDNIKDINDKLLEYNGNLGELETKSNKAKDIILKEKYIKDSIQNNKNRINVLNETINKSKDALIEIDESTLNEFIDKKNNIEVAYNELFNRKTHLVLLRSLYSDDGIKTLIIKKYLPTINKLLNTYLTKFQSDIMFNFDSDFNEVVVTKYKEDFTYESFSQGQKKRIDLAVMFAFIKFSQLKNKKSDSNILIMDEVLTSLDSQGTQAVMEVLQEYKDKHNKCIITINHLSDMNDEFFDYSYNVTLEKGYSKIVEVK